MEATATQPKSVGEIVTLVGIQQSGVSRHLRILGEAGFVTQKQEGTRHIYELQPARFKEIDDWLSRFRQMWEDRPKRKAESDND